MQLLAMTFPTRIMVILLVVHKKKRMGNPGVPAGLDPVGWEALTTGQKTIGAHRTTRCGETDSVSTLHSLHTTC